MHTALFVVTALVLVLLIALSNHVDTRLDVISRQLTRIENALGAEEWIELLEGAGNGTFSEIRQAGIIERLERIEVAIDPMARARHDVEQVLRKLTAAFEDDPSYEYDGLEVFEIQEQLEKGERPQRDAWNLWIKTPFPWQ